MASRDKTRIPIQGRSEGDGMENISSIEVERKSSQRIVDSQQTVIKHFPKRFVTSPEKRKEPKFVPYEPYKAAVSPIVAHPVKYAKNTVSNYVIDSQRVNSLASSLIKHNSSKQIHHILDKKNISLEVSDSSCCQKCSSYCDKRIDMLEDKVMLLEKEKQEISSQFQIQTEVNADLKKMLIASLGEDMQLKVQHMTEDKVRLGKKVLCSSHELSIQNEEIEKLSVRCDVWKSKFDASSLMVDELAGWKVSLSQKLNEAVQALDSLLKEHNMIFEELCSTYGILKSTLAAFDPCAKVIQKWCLPSMSLTCLSAELKSLSNSIQERLLGNSHHEPVFTETLQGSRQLTLAENAAYQFLNNLDAFPTSVTSGSSRRKKDGPGAVACQILPHVCLRDATLNCCKHCSGDIKTV